MATIVRVKRRIDEEPANSLLISYKRRRNDSCQNGKNEPDGSEVKSLFKIATTITSKEDNITRHVEKAVNLKRHKHQVNIVEKSRNNKKKAASRDRLKVVCSRRGIDLKSLEECPQQRTKADVNPDIPSQEKAVDSPEPGALATADHIPTTGAQTFLTNFCLYDVEDTDSTVKDLGSAPPEQITCNNVVLQRERRTQTETPAAEYVYDIYVTARTQTDWLQPGEDPCAITAIEPVYLNDDELVEDSESLDVDVAGDDQDDSNDESNWRNDYPDEDADLHDNSEVDEEWTYGGDYHEECVAAGYHEDSVSHMLGDRLKICDSESDEGDFDFYGEEEAQEDCPWTEHRGRGSSATYSYRYSSHKTVTTAEFEDKNLSDERS